MNWNDYNDCLQAVRFDGLLIKYVEDHTPLICFEAIDNDAYALQYIENQTEKLCLKAVKKNGFVLKFVKEQTEEICLEAIKRSIEARGGSLLLDVHKQTLKIVEESLKQNKQCKEFIKWDHLLQDEQEYLRLKYELVC